MGALREGLAWKVGDHPQVGPPSPAGKSISKTCGGGGAGRGGGGPQDGKEWGLKAGPRAQSDGRNPGDRPAPALTPLPAGALLGVDIFAFPTSTNPVHVSSAPVFPGARTTGEDISQVPSPRNMSTYI